MKKQKRDVRLSLGLARKERSGEALVERPCAFVVVHVGSNDEVYLVLEEERF